LHDMVWIAEKKMLHLERQEDIRRYVMK
jgi:hypothetical protein